MPTYHALPILTCGSTYTFDDTLNSLDFFGNANDVFYTYIFLEHGETVTFDFHIRIHQPTANFNNNTEAIYGLPFIGLNLSGTPTGDHGDFNADFSHTFRNSGPPPYGSYSPARWIYMEYEATFGNVEFTTTASTCTELPGQPGHSTFTVPASTTTTHSGGGWSVGAA